MFTPPRYPVERQPTIVIMAQFERIADYNLLAARLDPSKSVRRAKCVIVRISAIVCTCTSQAVL